MAVARDRVSIVRRGSLAAGMMRHDPRVCFGGAAWSSVSYPLSDCPAKGQPLQSAFGGFPLARRFCGDAAWKDTREIGSTGRQRANRAGRPIRQGVPVAPLLAVCRRLQLKQVSSPAITTKPLPAEHGRRGLGRLAQRGSRRLMGFSVMRSPDRGHSKDGRRIASQAPLDRLGRCTDAAAPGSREAGKPTGLALLRPSTAHQEAIYEDR